MELFIVLGYLGELFLLINLILYLRALQNKSKAFKMFVLYLSLVFIIQVLTSFLGQVLHIPNLFLSNIFLIVQFFTLSFFYKELLNRKIIMYVFYIVSLFLVFQYIFDFGLFNRYNPIGISITQSILIIYSIVYFYNSLQKEHLVFLIVNIGIFFYLLSSTLIFASGNLVFDIEIPESMYILLLKANGILYIIFQTLIFIEWRKNYYKKTLKS